MSKHLQTFHDCGVFQPDPQLRPINTFKLALQSDGVRMHGSLLDQVPEAVAQNCPDWCSAVSRGHRLHRHPEDRTRSNVSEGCRGE
jgi:hypothetical protein